MAKYWNRLISMNGDRLTKQIFLFDTFTCKYNWCGDFKILCNKVDTSHEFDKCWKAMLVSLQQIMIYLKINGKYISNVSQN